MPTAEEVRPWMCEPSDNSKWPLRQDEEPELRAEIARAEAILGLDHDVEDDAGPLYSRETLDRAVLLLANHSTRINQLCGLRLPVPRIGPGPNRSVDLHWKREKWELLVNVPADAGQLAAFYGDNYGDQTIKGRLDTSAFNYGIVTWLMTN
jgi:hypothetical protein